MNRALEQEFARFRPLIPPRSNPDLPQVGEIRKRQHALDGERLPSVTERPEDCLIVAKQPVAEMTLAEEQPDPFDRVQLGTVGWLKNERDIARNHELAGDMPTGLIQHHGRVFVSGEGRGKAGEEHLHGGRVQLRQDQRKPLPGARLDRGEQMRPGVALIAQTRRPPATREPAMADPALLAKPRLVLKPERQALARLSRRDAIQLVLKPPFWNACRAAGSTFGCEGLAFCRDSPSFFISLDMCPSW